MTTKLTITSARIVAMRYGHNLQLYTTLNMGHYGLNATITFQNVSGDWMLDSDSLNTQAVKTISAFMAKLPDWHKMAELTAIVAKHGLPADQMPAVLKFIDMNSGYAPDSPRMFEAFRSAFYELTAVNGPAL
jgi:hypothetical protein